MQRAFKAPSFMWLSRCFWLKWLYARHVHRGQNFTDFLDLLAQVKKGSVDGIPVRLGKLQVGAMNGAVAGLYNNQKQEWLLTFIHMLSFGLINSVPLNLLCVWVVQRWYISPTPGEELLKVEASRILGWCTNHLLLFARSDLQVVSASHELDFY